MNKLIFPIITTVLMTVSLSAVAAKPVKITPGSKGVAADGSAFRNYEVQCSNGKKQPITSWDNGQKWCVGEASQENCTKKQIKAAKIACKLD